MSIPNNVEILAPWRIIGSGPDQAPGFHVAELEKEVCRGHVLYGVKATAVALRVDRDDVLFELSGAEKPLAVVHLTWKKEISLLWPLTDFFESWEQWVRDEMVPAHEEQML